MDYLIPASLDEAVHLTATRGGSRFIAGGLGLVPEIKRGGAKPRALIDVSRLAELRKVSVDHDELVVGAAVRSTELGASQLVREYAPSLSVAARCLGDRQIRNVGTLGGSLAQADPRSELSVNALALDAVLVTVGTHGTRRIPVIDFLLGYRVTSLRPTELITQIRFPVRENWLWHYAKYGITRQRSPAATVAVGLKQVSGEISEARVAVGGVASRPVRAMETEQSLCGRNCTVGELSTSVSAADFEFLLEEANPLGTEKKYIDCCDTTSYKAHIAHVLTVRALETAQARLLKIQN